MSLAITATKPQGDPGLFGDILGKVTGIATSFIPGPAGAIARNVQSRIFSPNGGAARAPARAVSTSKWRERLVAAMPGPQAPLPSIMPTPSQPMNGAPFAQPGTAITMPTGAVGVDTTPAIGCPKGYKPNKSGYFRTIKSPGNPQGSVYYIQPGSRCVKIRRRNAANPRAADRALGRIKSAKRFAKKMSAVTIRSTCGCKKARSRK